MSGAAIINSGSVSSSKLRDEDLFRAAVTASKPEPEPKSTFVPSWEKEEDDIEIKEEEPVFKPITKIVTHSDPELEKAIRKVREALANQVRDAVMKDNTTEAKDLMSMTASELFNHLS